MGSGQESLFGRNRIHHVRAYIDPVVFNLKQTGYGARDAWHVAVDEEIPVVVASKCRYDAIPDCKMDWPGEPRRLCSGHRDPTST